MKSQSILPATGLLGLMLVTACGLAAPRLQPPQYASNGEQIYFTSANSRGQRVTYSGGPAFGGMGMMRGGLTCASCHGQDGRGGLHTMHMQVMDAPDIRWAALSGAAAGDHGAGGADDGHDHDHGADAADYDLETFRQAVVLGQHPDGAALSRDMPRWNIGEDDLAELAAFLQTLP